MAQLAINNHTFWAPRIPHYWHLRSHAVNRKESHRDKALGGQYSCKLDPQLGNPGALYVWNGNANKI